MTTLEVKIISATIFQSFCTIYTGICPVLCNGRGEYLYGQCLCHAGWKGAECNIAWNECLIPDCSGHGMCAQGECLCESGYTGEYCNQGKIASASKVCTFHEYAPLSWTGCLIL